MLVFHVLTCILAKEERELPKNPKSPCFCQYLKEINTHILGKLKTVHGKLDVSSFCMSSTAVWKMTHPIYLHELNDIGRVVKAWLMSTVGRR